MAKRRQAEERIFTNTSINITDNGIFFASSLKYLHHCIVVVFLLGMIPDIVTLNDDKIFIIY